jgi:hypothetical protein
MLKNCVFGTYRASATKTYSAQMIFNTRNHPNLYNFASLDRQRPNDALSNERFSTAMRLCRTQQEIRFASTHAALFGYLTDPARR